MEIEKLVEKNGKGNFDLEGEDGNAFASLGRVSKALKRAGLVDLVDEFIEEATSGDYNHLLETVLDYVEEDKE